MTAPIPTLEPFVRQRTVLLTTYRRDGTPVGTPVELVHLPVEVIVAVGNIAAEAAKRASSTLPIVVPAMGDPVGTGLVESLSRPGGTSLG